MFIFVADVLKGYNGTIFAYGQTSSGKTHTMFGRMGEGDDPTMHGIVPRAAHEVLEGIRFKEASGVKTKIFVSYVEIYGEQVLIFCSLLSDSLQLTGALYGTCR